MMLQNADAHRKPPQSRLTGQKDQKRRQVEYVQVCKRMIGPEGANFTQLKDFGNCQVRSKNNPEQELGHNTPGAWSSSGLQGSQRRQPCKKPRAARSLGVLGLATRPKIFPGGCKMLTHCCQQ